MSALFRKEAVDYAARRLAGEVVLASPLSLKLLSGLCVVVVIAVLVFALYASYEHRETVQGWVVPQGGLIRVTARASGIVDAIHVREGAKVSAGARLAVLRLSSEVAAGDVGRAFQQGLSAEASATAAEVRASRLKLTAQHDEMIRRRNILSRELEETRDRVNTMEQRQKLAEDQVARGQQLLARGFLAPQQMDQLRSTALSAAQDASQTRATVLELERQLSDLSAELGAVPADLANIDAQAAQSRANMAQRRVTAESQNTFVATAPIPARVLAIPVEVGQSVAAGSAIAVLTPSNSRLMAELYVPSRSAGFIQAGQEVRLMYQAFPYQTFGTGKGIIETVSRTVLAPSEVAITGLAVQEPVFRVRVRLERPSVNAYGHVIPLQPGMLLNADIVTDRRNLVQWLLDPIYAAGRRQ